MQPRLRTLLASTLLLGAFDASAVAQTSIKLSPTTIAIPFGESSASISVRNDSAEEVTLQAQAFRWRNGRQGDMVLDRTEELVVFPTSLILRPGETRRVRLGVRAVAAQTELSYRLILEQVGNLVNSTARQGAEIDMRMRFSLPVFVQPKSRTASVDLQSLTIAQGQLRVALNNLGGLHLTPRTVLVRGLDDRGTVVWTQEFPAWYLLAGESREYSATVHADRCARAKSVTAEVTFLEGNRLTLTKSQPVLSGACLAN